MNQTPFISVVIPTYNRASLVLHAIQSVLNQTYTNMEVLVIDDGSTDKTKNAIQSIDDTRVKYHYQPNQGVSTARNTGILLAKGEWIAFLDSDDLWLPKKIEKQLEKIYNEKTLWCYTQEIWIRNGKKINQHKKHLKTRGRIYLDSLPLCMVGPSTTFIHKSIFQKVGLFDPLLFAAEDYDLWLRISSIYPISFCSDPLIEKHAGHTDQLSTAFLGLDRFRVRALKKQLDSIYLSEEELNATRSLLIKKCRILAQGFRKHNKIIVAEYYENLANQNAI